MEANMQSATRVAMFPCHGTSHLIPCVDLAKQLVLNHGLSVTLITITDPVVNPQGMDAVLNSLPAGITPVTLPPVDLPSDLNFLARLSLGIRHSLPALRTVLHRLKQTTPVAALIADSFCADSIDVAKEVGVAPFLFFTSNLYWFSYNFRVMSSLEESAADLPEPVRLPGCLPIYRKDLPEDLEDDLARAFFIDCAKRIREAQGILVNSFCELEPETSAVLREDEPGRPPVYNVGPLTKVGDSKTTKPVECLVHTREEMIMPVSNILTTITGIFPTEEQLRHTYLHYSIHIYFYLATEVEMLLNSGGICTVLYCHCQVVPAREKAESLHLHMHTK